MARAKDRYGRLLANLWMGEAYLGEVLVAKPSSHCFGPPRIV